MSILAFKEEVRYKTALHSMKAFLQSYKSYMTSVIKDHRNGYCTSGLDIHLLKVLYLAGDIRDTVSIPGSGRSPGGGHGNPLHYSCLENPMSLWDTVHGVA